MTSLLNAVENNDKLFPIVASKLSQKDPVTYSAVAQKLGHWLSNEKAYYAAARPEIIKLLGVAHVSLRHAVGADVNPKVPFHISAYLSHPMVGPYARLLKAVYPYKHLFTEADLQEQLRSLFNTIMTPSTFPVAPHISGPTGLSLSQSHSVSLARHDRTVNRQPSSSSLASALEIVPPSASPHGSTGSIFPSTQPPPTTKSLPSPHPTNQPIPLDSIRGQLKGSETSLVQSKQSLLHRQVPSPGSFSVPAFQNLQAGITSKVLDSGASSPSLPVTGISMQGELATISNPGIPTNPRSTLPISTADENQPPVKLKKKRKRPLPSDILAKDIEELNRKRSTQGSQILIKKEPTEAIELLGDVNESMTTYPLAGSEEVQPSPAQYLANNLPAVDKPSEILPPPIEISSDSVQQYPTQSVSRLSKSLELEQTGSSTALIPQTFGTIPKHMVLDQPGTSSDRTTELEGSVPSEQPPQAPGAQSHNSFMATPVNDVQDPSLDIVEDVDVDMTSPPTPPGQEKGHMAPTSTFTTDDLQSTSNTPASRECDDNLGELTVSLDMDVPETPSVTTGDVNEVSLSLQRIPKLTSNQPAIATRERVLLAPPPVSALDVIPVVQSVESKAGSATSRRASLEAGLRGEERTSPSPPQTSPMPNAAGITQGDSSNLNADFLPLIDVQTPMNSTPVLDSISDNTETAIDKSPKTLVTLSTFNTSISTPEPSMHPGINNPEGSDVSMQETVILPLSTSSSLKLTSEVDRVGSWTGTHAFGDEMRILALHRGLGSRSKVTIRFDVPQEQYAAIQLWNTRNKLTSTMDLKKSLCLSLSCYSKETTRTMNNLTDLSTLPSHWPQAGELFMNVLYKEQRSLFSLSPPFQADPNDFVDVSKFLRPGSNTIELSQCSDMRGYMVVLRAHYPTPNQLEKVAQQHKKNQDWEHWLCHACQPLDVPIPVFS